jgi:hypothetical protein
MADLSLDIVDSAQAQEVSGLLVFEYLEAKLYDEYGDPQYSDPSEDVWVDEVTTVIFWPYHLDEEPRYEYKMKVPVRRLSASITRESFYTEANTKIPGRSCLGYFGARLSETVPVRLISAAEMSTDVGLSGGSNRAPVWNVSGSFGGRLDERIPVRSLVASFMFAGTFSLDSKLPVWSLSGLFKYPSSFTLNRQTPIWIGQGNLGLTQLGSTLASKIPGAFVFSGTMSANSSFSLAENIPVFELESTMYSGEMWLGSNLPAWMMSGSSSTGGGGVSGGMSEESRFSDYVLRYIRP